MDKSNLLKALHDNGLFAEFDDLYRDDVTVRDWVSRHEDLVRSNRAVAQALQVDAPHDVNEGYFKDEDEQRQYDAGEKKYNEERAKKQQLADEYKRSKNLTKAEKYLGNKYANKNVIEGKYGTALANEVAAKLGFLTDFSPFPVSMLGPVVRLNQTTWNEPDKVTDFATWRDFVLDLGTSMLGPANGFAKAGYDGVKNLAGPLLGKLFDTKHMKDIERGLEALDASEAAKIADNRRREVMTKTDEFKSLFDKVKFSDKQALDYADEIEKEYPELANSLREYVNAIAANRSAARVLDVAKYTKADNIAKKEAADIINGKKLSETKEKAQNALYEAQGDATKAVYNNDVYFDKADNLAQPVNDLAEQYKAYKTLKNANTAAAKAILAGSKPIMKASMGVYADDKNDYQQYEKDYNSAIEYIIQSNKRQWKAGFTPRGGIELEAYNIAKERGEI